MSSVFDRKNLRECTETLGPCTTSFSTFLRNQHPHDTVHWVSSLTRVKEATVEKWLQERAMPRLDNLWPLLEVYGPSVLAAIYPKAPRWLDEITRLEEGRKLDDEIAKLSAARRRLDSEAINDGAPAHDLPPDR